LDSINLKGRRYPVSRGRDASLHREIHQDHVSINLVNTLLIVRPFITTGSVTCHPPPPANIQSSVISPLFLLFQGHRHRHFRSGLPQLADDQTQVLGDRPPTSEGPARPGGLRQGVPGPRHHQHGLRRSTCRLK
jgi:hypothetical protein